MKRPSYSWIICAGCTLLLFCTVGLSTSAFSVYQPYIISAGSLSNTQGSTVITIRSLFALAGMLFVEKFYGRIGIRLGIAIAALGSASAFFIYSMAQSFAGFCTAAAVSGVAYGLGGMIPVSVIIGRWFRSHRSLALGICTAGTGLATVISPPIITSLIKNTSLSLAFISEAAFIGIAAIVVFAVLRNSPEDKGTVPLGADVDTEKPLKAVCGPVMTRKDSVVMLIAMIMIGAVANTGFAHLSVLYKGEGFDSMSVAFLLSFVGIALTIGKCVYGQVSDWLGAYVADYIFFALLIIGESLCCLAGDRSLPVAYSAMICLGLGIPLSTVGLSVIAGDMAEADKYASTVKKFQVAYMVGALISGPFPGMIADYTGTYIPAYIVFTAFSAMSMILIQTTFRRIKIRRREEILLSGTICLH